MRRYFILELTPLTKYYRWVNWVRSGVWDSATEFTVIQKGDRLLASYVSFVMAGNPIFGSRLQYLSTYSELEKPRINRYYEFYFHAEVIFLEIIVRKNVKHIQGL